MPTTRSESTVTGSSSLTSNTIALSHIHIPSVAETFSEGGQLHSGCGLSMTGNRHRSGTNSSASTSFGTIPTSPRPQAGDDWDLLASAPSIQIPTLVVGPSTTELLTPSSPVTQRCRSFLRRTTSNSRTETPRSSRTPSRSPSATRPRPPTAPQSKVVPATARCAPPLVGRVAPTNKDTRAIK